ncbi:ribosomal maturation YjgA family protein [Shewanella sp. 125m-7]
MAKGFKLTKDVECIKEVGVTGEQNKPCLRFSLARGLASLILLLLLIVIAVFARDAFIRPILGDVLVVVWLYYCLSSFINLPAQTLVMVTVLIAFAVEFAQYLHLAKLLGLQPSSVLSVILGATFDWLDLGAYLVGAATCVITERILSNKR